MNKFELLLLAAPVLLFSMVAHEYAHGYAALRQGDNTAQLLGRLTWNPLKHIDPFMTLIVPLVTFLSFGVAFGGAKPVPVDPRNYRDYRRGDIIVSLAGVVTNFVLAIVLTVLVIPVGLLGRALPALASSLALLQVMFLIGITLNLLLGFFNLIPIPPLDGSHVVKHLLPASWAWQYQRVGRWGLFLVLGLILIGKSPFNTLMQPVFTLTDWATQLVTPFLLSRS